MTRLSKDKRLRVDWRRRLSFLTVGTVAGAAGFESSEGALVMTNDLRAITKDTPATDGQIDLDGDGVVDFGLVLGSGFGNDTAGNNAWLQAGGQNGAMLAFNSLAAAHPLALQASDLVGGSLAFKAGIKWLAASSNSFCNGRGNWHQGEDAYLGIMFESGGQDLYGWVHVVWDADCATATIDQWGYEDAGTTAVIPLPPPPVEEPMGSVAVGDVFEPELGRVELVWPVHCGYTYDLQRCDGLEDGSWETIHTVSPTADGEASFLDDEFEGAPKTRCFYRVQRSSVPLVLLAMGRRRKRS